MCRKSRSIKGSPSLRKHYLFDKGADKLMDELDCVTILKSVK